jgi:hypothetical protein
VRREVVANALYNYCRLGMLSTVQTLVGLGVVDAHGHFDQAFRFARAYGQHAVATWLYNQGGVAYCTDCFVPTP